jgi:hypothetical protein
MNRRDLLRELAAGLTVSQAVLLRADAVIQ